MRRILSTYMFVSRKLTAELLGQIAEAEFEAVEIFGTRGHFDYTTKQEIQAIASALSQHGLTLASLHAPTSRDLSATREGGTPLSITEVERVRRIEAMDELKRVIDVAEDLPFSRLILHMGGARETADPRTRDPSYLRAFVDETRLTGLRFNFDIGHAHLADGPEAERIEKGFAPLRELAVSAHIHDNHGEKDEHLPPYDGTIDWESAVKVLKSAPEAELPFTLELKEKTGHDAPSAAEQLVAASASLDRFEREWS